MVSDAVKGALVAGLISVLLFSATYYYYWLPQLQQQAQEISLLQEQLSTTSRLQISLYPSDGWNYTYLADVACAIVNRNTVFRFSINNTSSQTVQIVAFKVRATNWGGDLSFGPPSKEPIVVTHGHSISQDFGWKFEPTSSFGRQWEIAQFHFTVITVELAPQTQSYCIIYSA